MSTTQRLTTRMASPPARVPRGSLSDLRRATARLRYPGLLTCICVFVLLAMVADAGSLVYQTRLYAGVFVRVIGPYVFLGLLCFALHRDRTEPLDAMRRTVRAYAPRFFEVLVPFVLLMAAFTTLKTAIPAVVPFYADPALAELEAGLLGRDAWAVAHDLVPGWLSRVIFWLYGGPWFSCWLMTMMYVALQPAGPARTRYLWAFTLKMMLLGVGLATMASSVGPLFYDAIYGGTRFAGLVAALDHPASQDVLLSSRHLLTTYETGAQGLGSGISALPSIHCAAAFLNAFFWSERNTVAGALAWGFAALIFVGSVLTGYHWIADGVVSFVGVALIWYGTGFFQRRAARRFASATSVSVGTKPSI